jgi:hypothetical protein
VDSKGRLEQQRVHDIVRSANHVLNLSIVAEEV